MHHLANIMTKLCHGMEQASVVEVGICLYARGWMNLDSLRFGIKYAYAVIGDLIHHDKSK